MLTDPISILSDQRKNPQSALTRAFGLDSEGTGVIPINKVPPILITGGRDDQTGLSPGALGGFKRLPQRKPKAPTKGTPITNRDLRDYYDNIERIQIKGVNYLVVSKETY